MKTQTVDTEDTSTEVDLLANQQEDELMDEYPQPPNGMPGGYAIRDHGLCTFSKSKNGEGVVNEPFTAGTFWIDQLVLCPVTNERYYSVGKVPYGDHEVKYTLIKADLLAGKDWQKHLLNHGVIIYTEKTAKQYLSHSAAFCVKNNKQRLTLVSKPGWIVNDKGSYSGYFTGEKATFANSADRSSYYVSPTADSLFRSKGTLKGWHKHVGRYIEANPMLLAFLCVAIASMLLQQLGLNSKLFNLHGLKGCGKTLILQTAATIFGCGIDPAQGDSSEDPAYITKFSMTSNGLEPLLAQYSPGPVLLDELTEQKIFRDLFYKASSGGGTHRMTSQGKAAHRHTWQVNIVSTAEVSVREAAANAGRQLLGGELDRAVDIPISKDTFVDFVDHQDFQGFTGHLKKACAQYYGVAGERIIKYILDNPAEVQDCIGLLEGLEEYFAPANCGDGERRVVKHFAGAAVAGLIAIKAGVLKCEEEAVMAAVGLLTNTWWRGRASCLATIAELIDSGEVPVTATKPKISLSARIFIHESQFVIPRQLFDEQFGDQASGMLNELAGLGALVYEQPNRRLCRFDNNRLFAYVIPPDRLLPLIQSEEIRAKLGAAAS